MEAYVYHRRGGVEVGEADYQSWITAEDVRMEPGCGFGTKGIRWMKP